MSKLLWIVVASTLALSMAVTSKAEGESLNMSRLSEAPAIAIPRARSGLELQTSANDQLWGIASAAWSVDLDDGIIEFRNKNGWLISAPVQVIGTYDTRDGTFMWGWDHPSVPEQSAFAAKQVFEYGKQHGIEKMTARIVTITEGEAWNFTALANHLAQGSGAYRGPSGTTLVFMTFGEVTITKP